MDLLQGLLGGDQRQGLEDFAGRYEQGAPWDGVSDREAVDRSDRLDVPGYIQSQDAVPGSTQPRDQPCALRPAEQVVHVSHVHASRVDSYQHLIVLGDRLVDVLEFEHIR